MDTTTAASPLVAQYVARVSGHSVECATAALADQVAHGASDAPGAALASLRVSGCASHCTTGGTVSALDNGSVWAQRRAARLAAVTTARLA